MVKKAKLLEGKMPKFGAKAVPDRVTRKGERKAGEYQRMTPEQKKAVIEANFEAGKTLFEAIKDGAETVTTTSGESVSVACVDKDDLKSFLGTKTGTVAAIMGATKRTLALGGKVFAKGMGRGIIYDKASDQICIYPDNIVDAPGKNIQTRVVYAKAATQGSEKFSSLIKSFNEAGLSVDATEKQVVDWLKEEGRFTGKKRPRGSAPKAAKASKPKKGKK